MNMDFPKKFTMPIIIFLLLISFITMPAFSQAPSKKEIQEQMQQVVKEMNNQIADLEKQIAEAKKNKEDESVIKELEEQVAMLKKQIEMMAGTNKSISAISEKIIQQATTKENNIEGVPQKDVNRIKLLPDKTLTDAELVVFVKNLNAEVAKKISPIQLEQAQIIYNTAKEKKQAVQIGNLASR